MSQVKVSAPLKVNEQTVTTIVDNASKTAVRAATKVALTAIQAEAPVGATKVLKAAHRMSVRRTPYGHQGRIRRLNDAWYGRIVERGRKPGRSKPKGRFRRGRRYPGARPNPFVDRAVLAIADEAERLLEAGAEQAAEAIRKRL